MRKSLSGRPEPALPQEDNADDDGGDDDDDDNDPVATFGLFLG